VIQQAMFLPEGVRRRVQVSLSPESGGQSTFETYSRPSDTEQQNAAWTMHATGSLVHQSNADADRSSTHATTADKVDLHGVRAGMSAVTSRDDFCRLMADRGLAYGPTFQVLDDLRRGAADAVAAAKLPESVVREATRYHLHPALGDALLQSMAGAVPLEQDG